MYTVRIISLWILACIGIAATGQERKHPSLLLAPGDGMVVRQNLDRYPLLKRSYDAIKQQADKALAEKMDVPVPIDPAGGYTHDRHKNNYTAMYNAGLLYSITGEAKYAKYVADMLLLYADLVPTLKNHPQAKSSSPGRLFHQALNDANWLVYTAQAYDCIYNYLNTNQRATIENGAFRPLCRFLTVDLKDWFNLLHNHGVWACAAVGMTGFAIGDDELVQQALYGTNKDGRSGFIAQLDHLYSPDGYYTEGPYYARYAVLPFYLFAQSIQNNKPALKIFEHRGQILKKALYAALQQTNTDGAFFPINDAIKDKTYTSSEMVFAISIAFDRYGGDKNLLGIAAEQKQYLLSGSGVKVAAAIQAAGKDIPGFNYMSVDYTDGAKGDEGGISLIRNGAGDALSTLFFKYAAHGLSHGHYDRLNILLYDAGHEILTDYGAARFLNIEQKDGGRYLPENKTFAMQTVAHNTLVVDERSNFDGKEASAEAAHPQKLFSYQANDVQAVSAIEKQAYKNVTMQRTLVTVMHNRQPVIIDLFKAISDMPHTYDLPFWYSGQFIDASFKYTAPGNTQQALGAANGYQHIWKEGSGKTAESVGALTLLNHAAFYSVSCLADTGTAFILMRSGANDPNFNLRREPGMLVRKRGNNGLFVNVIEKHGAFNSVAETASGSKPATTAIQVLHDDADFTAVRISFNKKASWLLIVANEATAREQEHSLQLGGKTISWTGPLYLQR